MRADVGINGMVRSQEEKKKKDVILAQAKRVDQNYSGPHHRPCGGNRKEANTLDSSWPGVSGNPLHAC